MTAIQSIAKRLRALIDKTALLMMLPCIVLLWYIDEAMLLTWCSGYWSRQSSPVWL